MDPSELIDLVDRLEQWVRGAEATRRAGSALEADALELLARLISRGKEGECMGEEPAFHAYLETLAKVELELNEQQRNLLGTKGRIQDELAATQSASKWAERSRNVT